jgi:hypothetical protein
VSLACLAIRSRSSSLKVSTTSTGPKISSRTGATKITGSTIPLSFPGPDTLTGEGGLLEKLGLALGKRCPERTQLQAILGPYFRRIAEGRRPKSR